MSADLARMAEVAKQLLKKCKHFQGLEAQRRNSKLSVDFKIAQLNNGLETSSKKRC
jgi:hypothetical protein